MKKIILFLLILSYQFGFSQSDKSNSAISITTEKVYLSDQVTVLPQFEGGKKSLDKFLKSNYKLPSKKGIKGEVLVSFVVEKNGTLSEIGIIGDAGYGTGFEAIRVMNISPKWIAGMLDGNPVRVQYMITIPVVTN